MNGPEFKPVVPDDTPRPRQLRPGCFRLYVPLGMSQENVYYLFKRLVTDVPLYIGPAKTEKVLLQVIGLADAETPYAARDLQRAATDVNDLLAEHAGSLFTNMKKSWSDFGVEPTENGSGMGEWDLGAFMLPADVPEHAFKLHTKFLPAFNAGLVRWYFSWGCKQS